MKRTLPLLLGLLASCTSVPEPVPLASLDVRVVDAPALLPVLADSMEYVPWAASRVSDSDEPAAEDALLVQVSLGVGLGCTECYAISGAGRGYAITASDVLGAQYGLTALLEAHGFRFFHPERPFGPGVLPELSEAQAFAAGLNGGTVRPQTAVRGLHPHTLHPIEGYYDFWAASLGRDAEAKRVIDWVIRQRGNTLQYPGVNDVYAGGGTLALWRNHTTALLEYAHSRGMKVGLGIQLFAGSNLQQALDLLPSFSNEATMRAQLEERLHLLLDATPFDHLSLSFGEFFGADPAEFIFAVNLAYEVAQQVAPGIGMTSVIHVGDDVVVEYEGEELIYYFLVKFADPRILPHVHTVMYYNLFEDAGGAYGHDSFPEHREFLFERLAADEPVGYFPETAYWVAYDNPVPTWIPFYAQSRWTDLSRIADEVAERGLRPLDEHVLFSSGWEWGYWQQDVLALRFSHTLPADWREGWRDLFSVWGAPGLALADAVAEASETQHRFLIEERLGAYLGGRDSTLDGGEGLGIIAQPPRVRISEVLGLPGEEREAFAAGPVAGMAAFATALEAHHEALAGLSGLSTLADGSPNRFYPEIVDGADVTAARARFIASLYGALIAHARGETEARDALLEAMDAARARGRSAVDRRHADLHDPSPELLIEPNSNATIYQFGYLTRAQDLCYWQRDEAQARNAIFGTELSVPGCAL